LNLLDEIYIKRCLELAKMGIPNAFPNPLVGCVIVYKGKIIGEAYHQEYGGPHAEVNAINAVKNKELLNEATVYVSLEPCAHQGKTPPCADLLVKHKVKRVVICNDDPFEKVDGEGISKLKKAGIKVEKGVLSSEGKELNRRFFTWIDKKRPFISLKWAQSKDGFISPNKQNVGEVFWISNNLSQTLAHKLRAENQAIIVGRKTAEMDDPSLDTRKVEGTSPLRMVLDSDVKLSHKLKLLSDPNPTIIFNRIKTETVANKKWIKYDGNALHAINDYCLKNNIQNLMVEGGASVLQSYIDEGLWDELHLFESDVNIGEGIKAPLFPRQKALKSLNLQADTYTIYRNV
jgi:diaminohydroxyphosphoribosylaminopyrimidine deaminase/5-amino-6-(5-phosphoribosylamino)uracil reductase